MNQILIQRYENGCLMLMDCREDAYHFLGTAFISHAKGYLLTAAHLLDAAHDPVVVNPSQPGVFSPLHVESGAAYPVTIAQKDTARNLALLKLEMQADLDVPADFIGNPETLAEGTTLLALGVSFGHFRMHKVMVMQAILSAKVISPNETRLLVFDSRIHPGDVGGPLVNTEKGRIVGIMQGVFNPLLVQQKEQPEGYDMRSHYSYAVSIEYARPLLEAEGLA